MKFIVALLTILFLGRVYNTNAQGQNQELSTLLIAADSINHPQELLDFLKTASMKVPGAQDSLRAKYFYFMGISYGMLYNIDSSKLFFNKSIEAAKLANEPLSQIGALNGLANLAQITSDTDEARRNYEMALQLADQSNEEIYVKWQSRLRGNLAGVFFDLNKYEDALHYSKTALGLAEQISDSTGMQMNLLQIGYCFNALSMTDSALAVNKRATSILEKIGDPISLSHQYFNMGNILMTKKDYSQARKYYIDCIELATEYNEYETLAGSLNGLGEIGIRTKNFNEAREYLNRSLNFSKENKLVSSTLQCYDLLYQLDTEIGDFESGINNLTQYHNLKDSVQNEENLKNLEEFKVKYETAEKEKEIEVANAEIEKKERFQTFLLILIAVIIIFSIVAIILIMQRFKLRRALLSQEIDTLRVQINSVFGGQSKSLDISLEQINEGLYKPLTEREFEILNAAISDKNNSEIAKEVFVSVNTVKYHLRNIYEKLGVSNRKEALKVLLSKA